MVPPPHTMRPPKKQCHTEQSSGYIHLSTRAPIPTLKFGHIESVYVTT